VINLYLVFTGRVFINTSPPPELNTVWGKSALFYALTLVAYISFSAVIMVYKWIKLRGIQRTQVGYTLVGIFSGAFVCVVLCAIIPIMFKTYYLAPFGPTFGLIMPLAIIYSILKHRLMDIYLVIRRSMIYSLLVIAIITIYGMVILAIKLFRSTATASRAHNPGMHIPSLRQASQSLSASILLSPYGPMPSNGSFS